MYSVPGLPEDLRPLPTAPYSERPAELALDVEECRTALWLDDGNVSKAAVRLKVRSSRLRTFIKTSPYLQREQEEAHERLVDTAEDVVSAALRDPERQDAASRFVLDRLGRRRGWGSGQTKVDVDARGGTMKFEWADGSSMTISPDDSVKQIEGEVVDAAS